MAATGRRDFGAEIARLLPLMLREVTRRQERIFLENNFVVSHVVVLDFLRERGSAPMGEISKVLGLTMSAATGIVDKMVEQGYVKRERSADDRRVVMVSLLRKGKDLIEKVVKARENLTNDMYSVLTEKEKDEYLRMLRKVHDNLRKKQDAND